MLRQRHGQCRQNHDTHVPACLAIHFRDESAPRVFMPFGMQPGTTAAFSVGATQAHRGSSTTHGANRVDTGGGSNESPKYLCRRHCKYTAATHTEHANALCKGSRRIVARWEHHPVEQISHCVHLCAYSSEFRLMSKPANHVQWVNECGHCTSPALSLAEVPRMLAESRDTNTYSSSNCAQQRKCQVSLRLARVPHAWVPHLWAFILHSMQHYHCRHDLRD